MSGFLRTQVSSGGQTMATGPVVETRLVITKVIPLSVLLASVFAVDRGNDGHG